MKISHKALIDLFSLSTNFASSMYPLLLIVSNLDVKKEWFIMDLQNGWWSKTVERNSIAIL